MQKEDIIIQEGREQDELRLAGIMSKGYGIIPKAVMLDRRLSDKAKAIYAFFCSFAGAGNSAFPKVSTICHYLKMNKDTYYKHFKQLVELGYIEVHQARDEEGKFSHNIYILKQEVYLPVGEEKVSEKKPKKDDKNMDTTKKSPSLKKSETVEPNPKKSDTVKPDTVNSDTNNNSFINNKKGNSNNLNNYHSFILSKEEEEKERQKEEEINQIFDNMQIDKLNEQKQTIDALKELIKDMYFSNRRMSVDGTSYHPKHIREAIKKLTIVHLEHALEQFKQASRERRIKNP